VRSDRTEFDLDDAAALRDPRETVSLLRACGGGDRAAFRRLYELWGARLHGIALRITHQPSLAADATHDAFVQVWQRAARFDPARGSPEAWVVSLVRYRALDIVRNRARIASHVEDGPVMEDAAYDALFDELMKRGGSDLHLGAGYPPLARIRGELVALREAVVEAKDLEDTELRPSTPACGLRPSPAEPAPWAARGPEPPAGSVRGHWVSTSSIHTPRKSRGINSISR